MNNDDDEMTSPRVLVPCNHQDVGNTVQCRCVIKVKKMLKSITCHCCKYNFAKMCFLQCPRMCFAQSMHNGFEIVCSFVSFFCVGVFPPSSKVLQQCPPPGTPGAGLSTDERLPEEGFPSPAHSQLCFETLCRFSSHNTCCWSSTGPWLSNQHSVCKDLRCQ